MSLTQDELAGLRDLLDVGDVEAVADELLRIFGIHWAEVSEWSAAALLNERKEEFRRELAFALLRRGSLNNTMVRILQQVLARVPIPLTGQAVEILRRDAGQPVSTRCPIVGTVARQVSLPAPREVLELLVRHIVQDGAYWPAERLTLFAEGWLETGEVLPDEVLTVMRHAVGRGYGRGRLAELITLPGYSPLNPGEAWADRANADLQGLGDDWRELVWFASSASSAKPSAKWEKQGRDLTARLGGEPVRRAITDWLGLVGRPRTQPLDVGRHGPDPNQMFDAYNTVVLRGLIWLVSFLPEHADTVRALGAVTETALRKVPGTGPRSPKIANTAVYALSRTEGEEALAQLARLASRVTFKGTLKEIDRALDARATALGLSRDEVEELAVPAYGLTRVGGRTEEFGEATAELAVTGTRAVLTWCNAAGKTVKSPPAAVRRDHAEKLAELKGSVKELDKMLSAQSERLDRLFLAQRSWSHAAWRERYLDHPLVGTFARRLIWLVGEVPVCYADGELRDVHGGVLTPAGGETVRLWHPIGRDVAEVLAWRDRLESLEIVQPFKQAHREVYLLTAAEENTGVYSNRYAAHVLRQHQFHALAAVRGWRNRLRLMVDDFCPPALRELPRWGLRAEFWVEGIGDDYGNDTTPSGAYHRIVTDQVRFYPLDAPGNAAHAYGGSYEQWVPVGADPEGPLPLERIPPLVFSEVMRDVDLFVGVASVGNDPTWQDGGPGGRFREYWASYGFGELSGSAQTRQDLLSRLLPRLAIGDRCTLEGRFLHVKGELRTYKIHLGSGNILMEPDDRYLCIVPEQTAAPVGGVFLPFEGDRMLAVILSKTMLLAKDTEITDPTIVRQIRY
ncbi:DUF4132 domain-containing protein [Rhizohabitans arisaemae]|uniref:DUF4132 domain-containing protein n=1 Tax=Rhizohabitans arisaemae TaxID=2720610 RepID=UPI0024B043E9|nr:DUF4132 domain-containing protein [Rhizohabitans arisaemae]